MIISIENLLFYELEPKISRVKGVPGTQTGGTPPGAIWRPLRTWRRMLRTIFGYNDNSNMKALCASTAKFHFELSFAARRRHLDAENRNF